MKKIVTLIKEKSNASNTCICQMLEKLRHDLLKPRLESQMIRVVPKHECAWNEIAS